MKPNWVLPGLALVLASGLCIAAIQNPPERFSMRVVTTDLEVPWEITWGPDNQLWVTERRGKRVMRVNPADGTKSIAVRIPEVHESVGQDGLLGMALDPGLLKGAGNDYVYVAFTYDDAPGPTLLRRIAVRRYTYDARSRMLGNPVDLITGLPSYNDHVAGRLVFGPDQKLYVSVGDQGSNFGANRCNPNRAQELPTQSEISAKDWIKYQGKILRLNLDGSIPSDNPVIAGVRSHIYSYGHRNPQGLVFGPGGKFYSSEHGPSSDDEVNLIALGMTRGRVYRLKLTADGLKVSGEAIEYFQTPNRYRDIAIHPDQRTFYFSTDTQGRTTNRLGQFSNSIENPGAILEFKYVQ